MNPTSDRWMAELGRLRIDRKDSPAPHKPLLLLTVIEMVEQGILQEPLLQLSGELSFRFLTLWPVVAARRNQPPEIWLPFFHLRTSGIWLPLDSAGRPTEERRQVVAARIDPEFFDCLLDPQFRNRLRVLLIDRYFSDPAERAALAEFAEVRLEQSGELRDEVARYEVAHRIVREARFRLSVVPAYDFTCALTGYRLVTSAAGSIVDAAHIHPFANSRNNDPRNGIALSKNAHWAFDQGLWSLTDDCRVILAKERFREAGPPQLLLASLEGKRILLPKRKELWPDQRYLDWHRRNKLLGA
ncbi:MAG: HNH endonuclease [Verrucomicrobiales bacterium]|nr:HNH endonuclease [Verrucomicrobiales bacterium]